MALAFGSDAAVVIAPIIKFQIAVPIVLNPFPAVVIAAIHVSALKSEFMAGSMNCLENAVNPAPKLCKN